MGNTTMTNHDRRFRNGRLEFRLSPAIDGWRVFIEGEELPCAVYLRPYEHSLGGDYRVLDIMGNIIHYGVSADSVQAFLLDYYVKETEG